MESVNLHELPRKELKQLCNEHHIRTAGVKHDDLIRLLRNRLYPPAPDLPRLSKGHSQMSINSQTSSKSTTEYGETLTRSTSKVQTQGSLEFVDDLSQDDIPKRSRKEPSPNPQVIRKPILTKSPARRSDFLRKKVNTLSVLDNQSHERQPRQSDGSPGKGHNVIRGRRKSIGSTSTVVNRPQERVSVKVNRAGKPQTNADAYSGATNSPRTSEGVASVTAVDSSDIGSHSIRSVSEIASDVGHRAVSEESDTDDLRSVSSEPAARFTSHINSLALRSSTGNELGRTGLFAWDSGHERESFKFPAGSNGINEQRLDVSAAPDGDSIFSYFLEDANSLVRSKSGPDSFLATPTADPGDVKRADERQVDSEQFLTPESSTAHHQERNTIDRKGSKREEVAFIHNNEAPLTDDLPKSLSGDRWLVDYEIAPVSEKTEVVDNNSALPLSESEARTGNLNSSNGDLPVAKLDAIVDGDNDIAPDSTESPGPSLEHVSAIAPASISDSSRSAETTEGVSITLNSIPGILDRWVEHNNSAVECQEKEEPKSLSVVESSFPSNNLSLLGNKLSSEVSDVLSHSGHITEEYCDNRRLEVECNSKASVEGVAGGEIDKSNEDQTEILATSQTNFERTQAANLPMICLSDEIGDVNDYSQHERSGVIATTSFLNFSHGYNQDGTSVGDAPCAVPDYIQDAKSTPSEPVEDRGDVKWNSVSALYDNLDEVNATDKMDGFGVFEHTLAETGESDSFLIRDFELQDHLNVRECEVANYAGPAATDVERHGVINEGNETASPSLSNVSVAQDSDLIQSEVTSKTIEQADVEEVFQDRSTGIALNPELFMPLMHTTEGEATSSHRQHERTRSDLNIPFAPSSYQVSDMHPESGALFSASQHYIEPVNCSVDQVEGEESSKPDDSLLQSSGDDVSGANLIRSFSQTWQNFEDFEDENTSAGLKEHTETWSDGIDQEGLELFIEQLPLAGEAESPTGLTDHESRMLSAQEQNGVHLQEDEQFHDLGSALDKFEVTSRDNTAASRHPPKLRQIFSVGLKVIFVLGSLTFGILKFRASRLRLQKRS